MEDVVRASVSELVQLGRLPTDDQADADPVLADRWAELIGQVYGEKPVTDAEATALVGLLPEDDSDCYGVAWTLLPSIESAPGWPLEEPLNSASGPWAQVLKERLEALRDH